MDFDDGRRREEDPRTGLSRDGVEFERAGEVTGVHREPECTNGSWKVGPSAADSIFTVSRTRSSSPFWAARGMVVEVVRGARAGGRWSEVRHHSSNNVKQAHDSAFLDEVGEFFIRTVVAEECVLPR